MSVSVIQSLLEVDLLKYTCLPVHEMNQNRAYNNHMCFLSVVMVQRGSLFIALRLKSYIREHNVSSLFSSACVRPCTITQCVRSSVLPD
jgi:hypothetical protein